MTGIAIGLIDAANIAVGSSEIEIVSVGETIVWQKQSGADYRVQFYMAEQSYQICGLNFARNPVGRTITTASQFTPEENTHPATWSDLATTTMHVRVTTITPPTQGMTYQYLNNSVPISEGVWSAVTAGNFKIETNSIDQPMTTLDSLFVRVEISNSASDADIRYNAVSEISVRKSFLIE